MIYYSRILHIIQDSGYLIILNLLPEKLVKNILQRNEDVIYLLLLFSHLYEAGHMHTNLMT